MSSFSRLKSTCRKRERTVLPLYNKKAMLYCVQAGTMQEKQEMLADEYGIEHSAVGDTCIIKNEDKITIFHIHNQKYSKQ